MAGRPIEIPIIVNADGAEKGVSKVSDSFDDLETDLKDTGKAGEKAGKQLSDSMDDAAKKIDRDLTKALDDVKTASKDSGRAIGRNVREGTDEAGRATEDFKNETKQNLSESVSSFRGDIEDIPQLLQDVLGGVSADLGVMGGGIAIAAAAAIGLTISALQGQADKINENKEKVISLAQAIKDNGGALRESDYISAMEDYGYAIQDTREWWELFQKDAVTGFEQMSKLSKDAGIDLKTAFDGSFGSAKDAEKGLEIVNRKLTDLKEKKEAVYNTTGSILDPVDNQALTSLDELKTKMEDNIKNQRVAEEMEKARRKAIEGTVEATLEDVDALRQRNDLIQDGVTTELDYRDQVAETAATLKENGKSLSINTQAGRDNQRALIDQSDAALDMAKSQLEAGTSADVVAANLGKQREALLLTLDGMTGNRAASEKLAESLGLIPKEVITEVKTNGVAESKTDIETIPATKDTKVTVDDGGTIAAVEGRVQSVTGKEVKIDVDDMYTVKAVQDRINGIKGRDEVKIDVDDVYTVREVQKRINGIQGRTVDVNVSLANLYSVQESLRQLTLPRTAYVDIVQREGKALP